MYRVKIVSDYEMVMQETDRYKHARANAVAALARIREMVARLEHANEDCDPDDEENQEDCPWEPGELSFGDYHDPDLAREAIEEDALSVEVRSGWYTPGGDSEPEEYMILLATGGPALRIIGELGEYGSVRTARLEMQDWFTPWQEYIGDSEDLDALLTYASVFYFG